MPLVPMRQVLDAAARGGYAVGAFNVTNLESVQAVIGAAAAVEAPVIVQVSQSGADYAGVHLISALVQAAAAAVPVPVALHLDHGTDFARIIACIRHGFSSVMFDGSAHDLAENIGRTREIVRIARAAGVSVEGEIGRIGGVEDDIAVDAAAAALTDPLEAIAFYEATAVDALALAVGTAHGAYRQAPRLDIERLQQVHRSTGAHLVLHGGSGVPDAQVRQAIAAGVRKVNIDTDLRQAAAERLRAAVAAAPEQTDLRRWLGPVREAMQAKVRERLQVFGAAGQA